MTDDLDNQDPKRKAHRGKDECDKPKVTRTKSRKRTIIICDAIAAVCVLFGSIFCFFRHASALLSCSLLFASVVLGALSMMLVLINYGSTRRRASLCSSGIIMLGLVGCFWLYRIVLSESDNRHSTVVEWPGDPYSGTLEPAHDPLPFPPQLSASNFAPDSVFLFAGSTVFTFGKTKSPSVVLFNGERLLGIDEENSKVFISGRFFDEDGKLLAELSSNKFNAALPPTTFRVSRPDKSTLIVRDSRGIEILNLKYLNPSAFKLTGIIRLPDKREIVITEDTVRGPMGLELHGTVLRAISVGGTAAAFVYRGGGYDFGVVSP